MNAINRNWPRWIYASVAKYFTDFCATNNLQLYIESAPIDKKSVQDWIELRIDGPNFSGRSAGEWGVTIEINIVISSAKDQVNGYRIFQNQGIVLEALTTAIPIVKLGVGVDDDQSVITCLQLKTESKEKLKNSNFGQIDPTTQLMQCMIDGIFYANLQSD